MLPLIFEHSMNVCCGHLDLKLFLVNKAWLVSLVKKYCINNQVRSELNRLNLGVVLQARVQGNVEPLSLCVSFEGQQVVLTCWYIIYKQQQALLPSLSPSLFAQTQLLLLLFLAYYSKRDCIHDHIRMNAF